MKKNIVLMAIAMSGSFAAMAQETSWEAKPVLHKPRPQYVKESAIILEDVRVHEYKKDAKDEMYVYTYNRRLVKVNDDKGVESYNKVYIYMPPNASMEELKARAILPGGKVIELNKDKILDVEEEGKKYKKFAIEGIEKGSEIEYYSLIKRPVFTFGLEIFQSFSAPFEKADFTLIVPEHLQFSVKGYNGFKVSGDTVINKKRITHAWEENIDALDDEKYAETGPYSKNVQYKLSYNLDKDKSVRMNTWNELAKNVYGFYNDFTEKEMKAIGGLYDQIKIPKGTSEEQQIVLIEDFIKTTINSDEDGIGEDGDKIEKIIKSKVSTHSGMTKLFIGIFEKAGIRTQIVFPSKRDELPLDEKFENYRLIDDMVLYFPGTGNFIDPVAAYLRYPDLQPYWAGTTGLFLKGTTIGTYKTAMASFDSIPLQPYDHSSSDMEVKIHFNETMDSLQLASKQILRGYSASAYRPAFSFLTPEKQEDATKDILKNVGKSDVIKNMKVENKKMTDASKNLPLTISGDISSAELIEKAGNKYLVKIGEVIGTQVEMYQEKKRQLPIILQYPHALDRSITFIIPQGYQVKNLKDLNIDIQDKPQSMGFVSSYKLNGNELKITVHEYYKEISYPIEMIDEYKKVVNAAADFNKIVLVVEKL